LIDDLDCSSSTLRLLAWQALRSYPVHALLALLDDDDYVVRTAVARQLHVRGGTDVFNWAAERATSELPVRRELAAFILGQLGTPAYPFREASIPLLTRLAADADEEVRATATAALGHLRADEAADILIASSKDNSDVVRQSAAAALAHLSSSDAVTAALLELLNDSDALVREWAADALTDFEGASGAEPS
jgi:HEAT repeat protein